MKKIMEMLQNMKAKNEKKDNKGFSLVELIIVIAIMAILVGIVGTQVIPYINKSKVSKDQQVLNSFSSAAVTAYAENAETMPTTGTITVNVYGTNTPDSPEATLAAAIQKNTGYDGTNGLANVKKQFASDAKTMTEDIVIVFDIDGHNVTTSIKYSSTPKEKVADVKATL
jgi:type IV pilus assembly protein PilA